MVQQEATRHPSPPHAPSLSPHPNFCYKPWCSSWSSRNKQRFSSQEEMFHKEYTQNSWNHFFFEVIWRFRGYPFKNGLLLSIYLSFGWNHDVRKAVIKYCGLCIRIPGAIIYPAGASCSYKLFTYALIDIDSGCSSRSLAPAEMWKAFPFHKARPSHAVKYLISSGRSVLFPDLLNITPFLRELANWDYVCTHWYLPSPVLPGPLLLSFLPQTTTRSLLAWGIVATLCS